MRVSRAYGDEIHDFVLFCLTASTLISILHQFTLPHWVKIWFRLVWGVGKCAISMHMIECAGNESLLFLVQVLSSSCFHFYLFYFRDSYDFSVLTSSFLRFSMSCLTNHTHSELSRRAARTFWLFRFRVSTKLCADLSLSFPRLRALRERAWWE